MFWNTSATLIYLCVAVWGLAFGGLPALLQTALAKAAGKAADAAQSMLVTVWNLASAGGGILGAMLLDGPGVGTFGGVVAGLLLSLLVSVRARDSGFPRTAQRPSN